ncbi:MAG TPA: SAM-dependent methyltransferase, partial [Aquihabitans sp.]|nr:SAM-dependent methyltransferase [Aquihabitans sp.]
HARAGRRVVRLKGGDPHLCSRGAEEAVALTARGIAVEVTPGVTAATAAGAASGLRRGASITVASGNHDPAGPVVDWASLGRDRGDGALVVLTGRAHQRQVADGLVGGGRDRATPAAVVASAGRPQIAVRPTPLGDLGAVRLPPPAAVVVAPDRPGGGRAHP